MRWPYRAPMHELASFCGRLASPKAERRFYWRMLLGTDRFALVLITRGRKGSPPEPPATAGRVRINPEFLAQSGVGLTGDELLHLRILQRMRALTQDRGTLDAGTASGVAMDVIEEMRAQDRADG